MNVEAFLEEALAGGTDLHLGVVTTDMDAPTDAGFLRPDAALTVVALTVVGAFPLWATVVIVAREVAVSLLRAWLGARGRPMPASAWGKVKTAAQMLVVLLYLLPGLDEAASSVRFWLLIAAVGLTVWSGIDYFLRAFRAPQRSVA